MLFLHSCKARGFVIIFSKLRIIWSIGIFIQLQITSRKLCTNCMSPKQSFNDLWSASHLKCSLTLNVSTRSLPWDSLVKGQTWLVPHPEGSSTEDSLFHPLYRENLSLLTQNAVYLWSRHYHEQWLSEGEIIQARVSKI